MKTRGAKRRQGPEYRSMVAKFLWEFAKCFQELDSPFEPPKISVGSADEQRFSENFDTIRKHIRFLAAPANGEGRDTLDCQTISPSDFKLKGLKGLFFKLDTLESVSDRDRALSAISQGTEADTIVRLMLFSSYLLHCVVLTRVETKDESRAFDIFDALNTTGEPLTAIETFKPRVMQYELLKCHAFLSKEAFGQIEEDLNQRFPRPDDRQRKPRT